VLEDAAYSVLMDKGTPFFYNLATGSTTWKAPRRFEHRPMALPGSELASTDAAEWQSSSHAHDRRRSASSFHSGTRDGMESLAGFVASGRHSMTHLSDTGEIQ
jgi:hypothetical protein